MNYGSSMNNMEIRLRSMETGVRFWQIGEALGMSDFTFSRLMRKELPEDKKAEILDLIDNIASGRRGKA